MISTIVPCCVMDTAVPIIIGLPTIAKYYPNLHNKMLQQRYDQMLSVDEQTLLSIYEAWRQPAALVILAEDAASNLASIELDQVTLLGCIKD
jgi:hypothetical protein